MKPPFKKDVTPVYEVPFDNPDLVAKANKNGSIIVNKDKVWNKPLMKEAVAHEKHHIKDMMKGDLDYDGEAVYFKGKKYDRDSFNEANENLPWEKEAYKAGREGKEEDLTPNKIKLDLKVDINGKGGYKSPISFKKMGNKWASQDKDSETVSMNEDFGMGMYGPGKYEGTSGGLSHPEETEEEKKKRLEAEAKEKSKKNEKLISENKETLEDGSTKVTRKFKGTGKSYEEAGVDPVAAQKYWDEHPEEYKAYKESQREEVEIIPPEKKDPVEPNVKIPDTANLATKLNEDRIIVGYQPNPRYDPQDPQGMKAAGIMKKLPVYGDAKKRDAVNTNSDIGDDSVMDDVNAGRNKFTGKNGDSEFNNTQIGNPGMFSKTKMY